MDAATRSAAADFRRAMRRLAGGVSLVSADGPAGRSGMTVTSVVSVSMDPPELLVSVHEQASCWPLIQASRRFGISVPAAGAEALARRFAGQDGVRGEQRYAGSRWHRSADGVWLLDDALAAFACELVQVTLHRGHALCIGRVTAVELGGAAAPLLYWQGDYRQLALPALLQE